MDQTLYERANQGAELLDEVRPEWHNELNLDTLNVSDEETCVLGQLYGSFEEGIGTILHGDAGVGHGFNIMMPIPDTIRVDLDAKKAFIKEAYAPLTQLWRELAIARRHMDAMTVLRDTERVPA